MPKKFLKWIIGAAVIIIVIIIIVIIVATKNNATFENPVDVALPIGAVVSNGGPCAEIGKNILKKYGNAIDSLIATMLCDGLATMNNMGIGGGFIATIYIKSKRKAFSLNARETAPLNSTINMYGSNKTLAQTGGLSVAIPGELKGYWEMYKKFGGKAPWSELFQPTINLCKTGVPINKHVAANIKSNDAEIRASPTLYSLLKKPDGSLPVEGDTVKLPKLAETLSLIAEQGIDVLYNGTLSKLLVEDIKKDGGIISLEDLANYHVRWEEPETFELKNGSLKMYSVPAPAAGPILGYSLSLLDGILPIKVDDNTLNTSTSFIPNLNDTFAITESFKYAYAIRSQLGDPRYHNLTNTLEKLADPVLKENRRKNLNIKVTSSDPKFYGANYYKEDHGTSNMAVLAPNGDAVVATSTVNLIFGSKLVSEKTGIILNDEMDDFSVPGFENYFGIPPSPSNFIVPGAIPQSSMSPAIFVDSESGEIKLAVGGAGGSRITTATAIVALRVLWYNISLAEAIRMPRFHHQLLPMVWYYDPYTPKELIDGMVARGHQVEEGQLINSCVTGILKKGVVIEASSDKRRNGNISYFYPDK